MTRNTKLYKTSFSKNKENIDVYYRDLTVLEISFLSNIKNDVIRYDIAAQSAIYNMDSNSIPLGVRIKIGQEALSKSLELTEDVRLLEISVSEFRKKIKRDDVMMAIKHIISIIPGQSFTELIKLTHKDLIELICLCEEIYGKPIFTFGNKAGVSLINPKSLPDGGKSLQQKMNELNNYFKD